jgi:hypothetical protein
VRAHEAVVLLAVSAPLPLLLLFRSRFEEVLPLDEGRPDKSKSTLVVVVTAGEGRRAVCVCALDCAAIVAAFPD